MRITHDRALVLPDGPLAIAKDRVLVVAVVDDYEKALAVVDVLGKVETLPKDGG